MTAQPLARFLVDFERERTRAWAVASGPARAVEPAPEILARHRDELAAARAAGREEGRADERGETERVLASVKRESEAQRAEARAAWVRDQGEVFATMLTESLDAIERRVTEQVAAVLSDLVLEAARARMVDELYHVYFEKRSFSSSGSRMSLTQRRSAMTKGSRFRRTSKSATRRVRSSALAWQW